MNNVYTLDARAVSLDIDRVLCALGYPTPEAASAKVKNDMLGIIEDTIDHAKPRAVVRLEDVCFIQPRTVQIINGPAFHGALFAKAIAPAFKAALFALTIGQEISEWLKELSARDIHIGFIADAAASELVESIADYFQNRLAEEVRAQNLFCGLRYCPGYCDWPIEELPHLLARLAPEKIGISLTQGGMMTPIKSIAGLIGLGPDPAAINVNLCETCAKTDCKHRRIIEKTKKESNRAPNR